MKEGVWGIGLIIISLITFAVVGTMINITTTTQQDYEYMKSSVEAAMYDARDEIQYRRGICVCTKVPGGPPKKIDDISEYSILRPNDESECDGMQGEEKKFEPSECRFMHGEYVVNSDIFVESLISRFGTVAKNNETYDITVQDVIEYPPKTSVEVVYYQYLFEAMGDGHTPIRNRMDAIFEGQDINPEKPEGSASVTVKKINCDDELVNESLTVTNISTGDQSTLSSGSSITLEVGSYILSDSEGHETSFTVDPNDIDAGRSIVAYVRTKPLSECPCDEPEEITTLTGTPEGDVYTITTHHYVEGTKTKVHADDVIGVKENGAYSTSPYSTSQLYTQYKNGNYVFNGVTPSNASGIATGDDTVKYYYKASIITGTQTPVETYTVTTHHLASDTGKKVHSDDVIGVIAGEYYSTSPYATSQLTSKYKNEKYGFDGNYPSNANGYATSDVDVTYYYSKESTVTVPNSYSVTVHHYKEGSTTRVYDDVVIKKNEGESYSTSPVSTFYDSFSDYEFNGAMPSNANGVVDKNITVKYYYKKKAAPPPPVEENNYVLTVHHYAKGTTTKLHDDDVYTKKNGDSYQTSSYSSSQLTNSSYSYDSDSGNTSGKMNGDVTVTYYYKQDGYIYNSDSCNWHAHISGYICTNSQGVNFDSDYGSYTSQSACSAGKSQLVNNAKNNAITHCPVGTTYKDITGFTGYRYYNVYYYGTYITACYNVEAEDAKSAVGKCNSCFGKSCIARCHN